MEEKLLLRIENVDKTYDMGEIKVEALKNATLQLYEGEFVVILGPSGSGKSTLLNIIGGMDHPTKGSVFIQDKEITQFDDRELTNYRRNDVGFVFQFYNLMSNLTAKENVELSTEICNDPLDINEIINAVGLGDRKNHFPSHMSGGEQQRVAIARAVAKNPLIILCDEPTGALDFETGILILSLLKRINTEYKKTIVIISHNTPIADMADRVIKMSSGKIIEITKNSNPIPPERIVW